MTEDRTVRGDTTRLRQAADKVDQVGHQTDDIMKTLRSTLQANDYPWGHDDYVDKLAKGGNGYGTSSENLLTVGDSLSGSGAKFSRGMHDAANKMDNMDSGEVSR